MILQGLLAAVNQYVFHDINPLRITDGYDQHHMLCLLVR
jgi:hypothetical protein